MKRLFFAILISIILCNTHAQDGMICSNQQLDEIVSKGNEQYDRSYRTGIKLYADSLERSLTARHEVGMLSYEDSLVYTADLLKLRADWHYENGNYDSNSYRQAEYLFQKALSIHKSNPNLTSWPHGAHMIQREMAQLMYKLGRYEEALNYTEDAYMAYSDALDRGDFEFDDFQYETMLQILSQKSMCMARTGKIDSAVDLINELVDTYPKGSGDYYEILRKKGKILLLSQKPDSDKEALMLYKKYFAQKKLEVMQIISTMTSSEREDYWMRIRPFIADCYQLEDADPAFLYDVTLFSKGFLLQINRLSGYGIASTEALKSLTYNWKQIQAKLPEKACAIEFVQYEKLGMQLMGAIVLNKKGPPKWVQMMSPDEFMKYEIGPWTNQERIYTTKRDKKDRMYRDTTLQSSLWSPELRKALGNSKRVYFAPDGYLHQLAIEYMLPSEMSELDVYRLSSTRRLMEKSRNRRDAALLVGGVLYDATDVDSGMGNDSLAYSYIQGCRVRFDYLAGSLAECDSIYAVRSTGNDTLLVDANASELALRKLCNLYPIINISTHGYFGAAKVSQGTDIKTCMTDESLSQCVLALAGASRNLSDTGYDTSQMDGLLSAQELSECDMSDVDLAVISACQTGLGYVTSDGVFGIQRGLKNAGVSSMIVSLWDVHDEATCILMSSFHKNLNAGMSYHKAFMSARKLMIHTKFDLPQYRDAFIIIDTID